MTAPSFIARAEAIGRRLADAEWDLIVADVELDAILAEAIKLADRRDAARELSADAAKRYRAALSDFFRLRDERDDAERLEVA